MPRLSLLLLLLTILTGSSSAQQTNIAETWQFHSINNVGILEGQIGSAFQLQTINGVQYKSWFCGAGLGLDYYKFRTIPLFFDLRKEFGKSVNKLFLYSDLGVHFSWVTDKEKTNYVVDDKFGNGIFAEAGLGYKAVIGKNHGLLISAGYSYKKLREAYNSLQYYPGLYMINSEQNINNQSQINYALSRLSIKMGWQF
jgi:hypothetical protein